MFFCDSGLDLWLFDPKINSFLGLIGGKFGDPSCIGFWDTVWTNRQTAVKTLPPPETTVGVGNKTNNYYYVMVIG